MKKTLSFVFAIAAFVLMFIGFTGCGKTTPPLSTIYSEKSKSSYSSEKVIEIRLVNRSGTETLVLRTDYAGGRTFILPPGESAYFTNRPKGESFKITADGYSMAIRGKTPK